MATVEERIKHYNEKRQKAWQAGRTILDRALEEGRRQLTAEERVGYDRAEAEMGKWERQRDELLNTDSARTERDGINS
jgi:hypothetical protein